MDVEFKKKFYSKFPYILIDVEQLTTYNLDLNQYLLKVIDIYIIMIHKYFYM